MAEIDSKLAMELKALLQRDERTAHAPIEAVDNSGIITLVGIVNCQRTRAAANLIVANHPDVLSVINDIHVDDPAATAEVGTVELGPVEMDQADVDKSGPDESEAGEADADTSDIDPIWPQRGDIAYPN